MPLHPAGGCDGATQEIAFGYVAAAGGLSLESDYPYQAVSGKCDTSKVSEILPQQLAVYPFASTCRFSATECVLSARLLLLRMCAHSPYCSFYLQIR